MKLMLHVEIPSLGHRSTQTLSITEPIVSMMTRLLEEAGTQGAFGWNMWLPPPQPLLLDQECTLRQYKYVFLLLYLFSPFFAIDFIFIFYSNIFLSFFLFLFLSFFLFSSSTFFDDYISLRHGDKIVINQEDSLEKPKYLQASSSILRCVVKNYHVFFPNDTR